MKQYSTKRVGARAPINLDKLEKHFMAIWNTPFHGVHVRLLEAHTKEEAEETVRQMNHGTQKGYPIVHLIDLRDALGVAVERINDSRS